MDRALAARAARAAGGPTGRRALTTASVGPARLEEPGLGREVRVHGAVVVEVVLGQVGEDGRGEADARRPGAGRGRGTTPPWPPPSHLTGAGSASGAWRSGASGVVRVPASVPIDAVGRPSALEDRGQQVRRRRLAVGPGDPDHGAGAGTDGRTGRRPAGRAAGRTADTTTWAHRQVEATLDEQRGRAGCPPRPGGEVVAVEAAGPARSSTATRGSTWRESAIDGGDLRPSQIVAARSRTEIPAAGRSAAASRRSSRTSDRSALSAGGSWPSSVGARRPRMRRRGRHGGGRGRRRRRPRVGTRPATVVVVSAPGRGRGGRRRSALARRCRRAGRQPPMWAGRAGVVAWPAASR